ncbi:type II toxin-antitoxin system RelE/ParE family toxin [Erwinia sp. E_sp_B04_7]|uniref:type II toxin-antitoxin system RelE/ParE family toxin n=1 Tax=unclassified Erwinia TaxID=2622719 RepID=UPI0030CA6945
MTYKLTQPALRHLTAISEYTQKEWGPAQEENSMGQLQTIMELLGKNPKTGTPRDDVRPGLRAYPIGRHNIYFRTAPHGVNIIAVLHQSQDPQKHL